MLTTIALIAAMAVPFEDPRWRMEAQLHQVTQYRGKRALLLHNGSAVLDGTTLTNAVVEFDIAMSGERAFGGPVFRDTGGGNYEHFYLRPHQSGNPDANQYTPVFNGVTGWQLYHGAGFATPTRYPLNEWLHVKLVFWDDQAEVYLGDMQRPALRIPQLKHAVGAGTVGLTAAYAPFWFADFSVRELTEAPFERIPLPTADAPPGSVMRWQVSDPFPLAELGAGLPAAFVDARRWRTLAAESDGLANLARLAGTADGDTVLAQTTVRADSPRLARLRIGYSDRARVYLNGRLLYDGDNTGFTRDYRYLGTIGLYEAVWLPLEAGENRVHVAVSERFGGWGLKAVCEGC